MTEIIYNQRNYNLQKEWYNNLKQDGLPDTKPSHWML